MKKYHCKKAPCEQILWFLAEGWTNRGVFPVEDDLRDVFRLFQHGLFAPVFAADSDHSICIHASKKKTQIR